MRYVVTQCGKFSERCVCEVLEESAKYDPIVYLCYYSNAKMPTSSRICEGTRAPRCGHTKV